MIEIRRDFDKTAGLMDVEALTGYVFSPEELAHKFIIRQIVDGVAVPFSGSVHGRFVRSDGMTVIINSGTTSGVDANGRAFVSLPRRCYTEPGRFTFSIFVITGNISTCVYCATGTVFLADSGNHFDEDDDPSDSGDGTNDYNMLSNKPKINSVELIGNRTSAELGLAIPLTNFEIEELLTEG